MVGGGMIGGVVDGIESGMRIDKWLWVARFFKTRGQAQQVVASGRLRLDGAPMTKAHRHIRAGQVLTFPKADAIRVIKVLGFASHRRPASEARLLYEDLAPPQAAVRAAHAVPVFEHRTQGSGRPTKKERRQIDRLKS